MPTSKKTKDTNSVARQRRIYADAGLKARSFVAEFAKASTATEIAARLFANKHPKPLEYLMELWRDRHIELPTRTVIDVMRAYDALLVARRTLG